MFDRTFVDYKNPRITFDGISWFISAGVEENYIAPKLAEEVVGVDLGLKTLAVCSNNIKVENISKSKKFRKLYKKQRRLQKRVSRKYLMNKQGNKFVKTKNIIKLEVKLRKLQIRLNNLKQDFFHKETTKLVRTKLKEVVLEDLNIKGMMKNKHLSKSFQRSSLCAFRTMLVNKCSRDNIIVTEADRFFPSSKLCSKCGTTKEDLKLKDRTYDCSNCGNSVDRDLNASLNLKNYSQFERMSSLWRVKQNCCSSGNTAKQDSVKQEFYMESNC